MSDKPQVDEGATLQTASGEFELKKGAQRIGKVGIWFGTHENAKVYFAAIFGLLAFVVLVGFAIFFAEYRSEIVKAVLGIMIATIGYAAGSTGGRGE